MNTATSSESVVMGHPINRPTHHDEVARSLQVHELCSSTDAQAHWGWKVLVMP